MHGWYVWRSVYWQLWDAAVQLSTGKVGRVRGIRTVQGGARKARRADPWSATSDAGGMMEATTIVVARSSYGWWQHGNHQHRIVAAGVLGRVDRTLWACRNDARNKGICPHCFTTRSMVVHSALAHTRNRSSQGRFWRPQPDCGNGKGSPACTWNNPEMLHRWATMVMW